MLALDVGTSSCRASLYDTRGRRLSTRAVPGELSADGDRRRRRRARCRAPVRARVRGDRRGARRCVDADPGGRHDDLLAQPHGCRRRRTPVDAGVSVAGRAQSGRNAAPASRARRGSRPRPNRLRAALELLARQARVAAANAARARRTRSALGVLRRVRAGTSDGLRGESVSMASGTGLFNQFTLEWDRDLLDAIGVDPACLSPILDESAPHASDKAGVRASLAGLARCALAARRSATARAATSALAAPRPIASR